jgi:hypothetical protein
LAFHSGREADHSPLYSAAVKEWVELYFQSPSTPSWRGAQLGRAQGQLYLYLCLYREGEAFLQRIAAGDETGDHHYEPDGERQSMKRKDVIAHDQEIQNCAFCWQIDVDAFFFFLRL